MSVQISKVTKQALVSSVWITFNLSTNTCYNKQYYEGKFQGKLDLIEDLWGVKLAGEIEREARRRSCMGL